MDNTLYYVDESLYEQYVVGDPENESLWTLDIYEETAKIFKRRQADDIL